MCTVIYNCFTDDNSSLSGPEINTDRIKFPNITVCIATLVELAKAYADATTAGLVITGKDFRPKSVFGAMKLPKSSANN